VQPSIFFIDYFVGTYRLSSHARLEAFVIQTKLNQAGCVITTSGAILSFLLYETSSPQQEPTMLIS
jgi:hypothetical protein